MKTELKKWIADYDCDATYENEDGEQVHDELEYEVYMLNMRYSKAIKGGKDGFFIIGTNLNWRGSSGFAYAKDMRDVANKILMHDGQCRTEVWKGKGNTIEAVSYHHDCPTGSRFVIMTMNKARKEYKEEVNQLNM